MNEQFEKCNDISIETLKRGRRTFFLGVLPKSSPEYKRLFKVVMKERIGDAGDSNTYPADVRRESAIC